ncbi:hypothetical protein ACIRNI_11660 [Streptomyces sp. NPDC093546]|uniref:hypothetical protein n=1 Tax=Streptomyces sp. NPDC093546 TaxID=3366040 RepID=UPI003800E46A
MAAIEAAVDAAAALGDGTRQRLRGQAPDLACPLLAACYVIVHPALRRFRIYAVPLNWLRRTRRRQAGDRT